MSKVIKVVKVFDKELITIKYKGEWYFVARQLVEALGYDKNYSTVVKGDSKSNPKVSEGYYIEVKKKDLKELVTDTVTSFKVAQRGEILVAELGIYELINKSEMPQAKLFQDFVYKQLRVLRKESNMELDEFVNDAITGANKLELKKYEQECKRLGIKPNGMIVHTFINRLMANWLGVKWSKDMNTDFYKEHLDPTVKDQRVIFLKEYVTVFSYVGSHKKADEMMRNKYGIEHIG